MSERAPGKIITFYSFKGGTGRTMALANTAWILASNGKRVLTVDWDLEAPGLHRYYHPFIADPALANTHGLIDMVFEYQRKLLSHPEAETIKGLPPEWYDDEVDVFHFITELKWSGSGFGALHLLPAGRQTPEYGSRVNTFNWRQLFDRGGGYEYFEAVKRQMRAEYDYILIDSRTGVSDTSGLCTVQMPDALVVCFTLNSQSIEGAGNVAATVREHRLGEYDDGTFRIFPVPTRLEKAEKLKLDLARNAARVKFDKYLGHLSPEDRERYWGRVEIYYEPFYAYEEVLATFADRPGSVGSLLASVERLCGYVAGVNSLIAPSEGQRQEILAAYERRQTTENDPSQRAAAFLRRLSTEDVEVVRRILLRMVEPGSAGLVSRRTLAVTELDHEFKAMAYRLTDEEILSRTLHEESRVEYFRIADERLLHSWPALNGWISESEEYVRRRNRLEDTADSWEREGKPESLLLRGGALEVAAQIASDRREVTASVLDFVRESQLTEVREREAAERKEESALRHNLEHLRYKSRYQRLTTALKSGAMITMALVLLAAIAYGVKPRAERFWKLRQLRTMMSSVDGMSYVWIPPGRFTMGCPDDDASCGDTLPVRREMPQGFWMGQTEVTDAAYRRFLESRYPSRAQKVPNDNMPVSYVNWLDAVEYCSWAGGRLPTSTEWEYAARGGVEGQRYITGSTLDLSQVNVNGDRARPVRSYAMNDFGLFDMTGNVAEWTLDPLYTRPYFAETGYPFDAAQHAAQRQDTTDLTSLSFVQPGPYTVRGGSYSSIAWEAQLHRTAPAWFNTTDPRLGFRCVIPQSDLERVAREYKVNPFSGAYAGVSAMYYQQPWLRFLYRDWFTLFYAKYLGSKQADANKSGK